MTPEQIAFESRFRLSAKHWGWCPEHGMQRIWKRLALICPRCTMDSAYADSEFFGSKLFLFLLGEYKKRCATLNELADAIRPFYINHLRCKP